MDNKLQLNKNSHKIGKHPIRKPNPSPPAAVAAPPITDPPPPQSQQPPVYNINKNDFRDVVQKLTGSPAHDRLPPPPPAAAGARPPSSRLQRIRPPPLAQIRPPNDAVHRHAPPLPPLPPVHAAAESPISAYMRFLHSSAVAPPPADSPVSSYLRLLHSSAVAPPPLSPLPFGCIPSPGFLFSPLPLSPTPPLSSPRWRGI